MTDFFSLDTTPGGANGSYSSNRTPFSDFSRGGQRPQSSMADQPPSSSPLSKLLADLRRKYAAAAGPQVGTVMEYGVLPYASDIDVEDLARRMNEKDSEIQSSRLRETSQNIQYSQHGWQRPGKHRFIDHRMNGDSGGRVPAPSTTPPSSPNGKRQSVHNTSSGDVDQSQTRATTRRTSTKSKLRRRSGLASTSHVENLLCSTPHLRHLSAASVDMEGRGTFSTSRNFLSHLLPSVQSSSGGSSADSMATSTSSKKSKGATSYMADYGISVAQSRANRQTAMDLASFVRVLTHEMNEEFASVENEIFTSIFALVHSTDNHKRIAGVAALDALIGVASSDEEKKAIKFANNLSNGLRANNVDYEFLNAVSQALGRMAMGATNVDYVEFEITRALEWLRTERSDRRYVVLIRRLSDNELSY